MSTHFRMLSLVMPTCEEVMNESSAEKTSCRICRSEEVYVRSTDATGHWGPNLLPGLGSNLMGLLSLGIAGRPQLEVHVCAGCGYIEFFADAKARHKAADAFGWKRLG